jgi:UDP-N-acetylmuramoylalanine--D-glutamate ligase
MRLDSQTIKGNLKSCLGLDSIASKIVIVGFGVTGVSVARFLQGLGFDFVVADSRESFPMNEQLIKEFGKLKIFSGKFDNKLFNNSTHLIVSPGIPLSEPVIKEAIAHSVKIVGDIDLFACSVTAPIVAITGSNGKSTVTTLLGEMAKAEGKLTGVGGNLGVPALDLLQDEAELYVLELSSFQLERTFCLNAAAATVLNISADHLDRHADIVDYAEQKQRIYNGDGVMVINLDDPIVSGMQEAGRNQLSFSIVNKADFWLGQDLENNYLMHGDESLFPLHELPLEGKHNSANALAALALGTAVGLDIKAMCKALKTFQGLEHRMQRVAEIRGVVWVNDSKATNIGACVAALQGYECKVILIAGGDAKGADMNELTPAIKEKAKSIVLMGKDACKIEQALNGCVPVHKAKDMQEAVAIASKLSAPGDCVLLSPACASLDQYRNYQDRGNQFTHAVLSLVA